MLDKRIEKCINDLIQLDVDAYFAYGEAIIEISDDDVRFQLEEFQNDHSRHIDELSDFIKKSGGEPIKKTKDVKGHMIEIMTMLRSLSGTEGALKAMHTTEKLVVKTYEAAVEIKGFSNEAQQLIVNNLHDEKRHLSYIESKLKALSKHAKEEIH